MDTPSLLERYELKYTIPASLATEVEDFILPYCLMDRHSEISPQGYYQVNSLYFDTPDFHFLNQRLQRVESRFNMRVRTYGAEPVLPYFLEIKQKRGDIIRKLRARIRDENLEHFLDPAEEVKKHLVDGRDILNAARFKRLVSVYNAAPVVMTSYLRKAFFSHCDEYARVTLDKSLRFCAQDGYSLLTLPDLMAPSDTETNFDDGCSVILELKCYSKYVPIWMIDLIRRFELRRRGFSKYSVAVSRVFQNQEYDLSQRVSPLVDFNR